MTINAFSPYLIRIKCFGLKYQIAIFVIICLRFETVNFLGIFYIAVF